MGWKLKRVRQCEKCPWKVSTDPHDIPNGYSEALHRGLASTIAEPGRVQIGGTIRALLGQWHRLRDATEEWVLVEKSNTKAAQDGHVNNS